ncbi:type II secretion system protein [Parashewanella hymeniacidonis]|uniref:type II secretion system protein n=1 Tax=Parashewanella hymeniacidonis TaxID=2807618 RepID=UPI0023E8BB36|nr:type II secretion system protein [Parashewanella hymeniacidonis]
MSIRGFTLIELVVVTLILGTLSVTALPKLVSINYDAGYSTAKHALKQFEVGALHFRYKCISAGLLGINYKNSDPGNAEFVRKIHEAGLLSRPSGHKNCFPEAEINDGRINSSTDCRVTFNAVVDTELNVVNYDQSVSNSNGDIIAQYAGRTSQCNFYYKKGFENLPDSKVPHLFYNAKNGSFTLLGFPE